jgi:hypothetical protein
MERLDVHAPDADEGEEAGWVKIDGILYSPDDARELADDIHSAARHAEEQRRIVERELRKAPGS